jgi:glycosyltransferase involved in cell wall biosynthesis
MHYAVCAEHMMSQLPAHTDRSKWHRIYNPINIRSCTFQETPAAAEPYLVFLSRMCIAKGPHHAIAVAKKTGRRLVLAGNVQATDQSYFDEAVKPHIDGKQISYIGPVNDDQKRELLGNADAMLFPITWEEPFGLVVGESLACGTPVLAFKRGAMPELIEDGRTGILCDTEEEMCAAVEKIPTLDRKECRILVESRFSPEIIAVEFERVYREMLNQPK